MVFQHNVYNGKKLYLMTDINTYFPEMINNWNPSNTYQQT